MFFSCSSDNMLEVKGIYLDLPWYSQYSDTNSKAFKDMAAEKAYKLFTLVKIQQENQEIIG